MSARNFIDFRDLTFWLFDIETDALVEPFLDHVDFSRAVVEDLLTETTRLSDQVFDGLPELLDAHEPTFDGKTVWNHERLKPALREYLDSGFFSAPFSTEWGGAGMPFAISLALGVPAIAVAGTGMSYLFLTSAAAKMLQLVGSAEQKQRYLPKLVSGEWFGTMMLSEAHAGSSVGDIRTRAVRQTDGTYHLTGSKMWISGGDHDLSENIIHMVLAKIDDGSGTQSGTAGISLFLVPKHLVNEDGTLGDRNGVKLSGINHKMGHRGIVNTVPVLGADEPCIGYLLGTPGKGLAAMFHMMNEARIGVGMVAAQFGYFGYRYSLEYARSRPQGRSASNKDPASPQIPIIQYTDVKRMLLQQKSLTEGAMALCFYAAKLIDQMQATSDAAQRTELGQILGVLTPIVKSWPSVWGLHANYLAIQVLGGYGYTRDFPVERLYRDNRLNEIHEGTTGIQSLDLLGRKVAGDNGVALSLLLARMERTAEAASQESSLDEYATALKEAIIRVRDTTAVLIGEAAAGRTERMLANSVTYLEMCGHIVVAWIWLRMALAAQAKLAHAGDDERRYLRGKLKACQYFFRAELPKTVSQAQLLQRLDDTCLMADADEF